MERGTLRVDANISVREAGSGEEREKVEVKNMNSVKSIEDAVRYEIDRQKEVYESGEDVILHTRLWDSEGNVTIPMRGKFSGPCIPDPSVPEVVLSKKWLSVLRSRLPEMPGARKKRIAKRYELSDQDAAVLAASREGTEFFEQMIADGVAEKSAARWLTGRLFPEMNRRNLRMADNPFRVEDFSALVKEVDSGKMTVDAAGRVLERIVSEPGLPFADVMRDELKRKRTTAGELEAIVERVLSKHESAVRDYRSGKKKALGFLTGEAVRESGGTVDPRSVRALIEKKIA